MRYVAAHCPAQKVDEYTPEAWADTFSELPYDLDLGQCKAAVRKLARNRPFIGPNDIIEVIQANHDQELARLSHEVLMASHGERRDRIARGEVPVELWSARGGPVSLKETITELRADLEKNGDQAPSGPS